MAFRRYSAVGYVPAGMWIVAVVSTRKETLQLELLGKPVPSPSDEEIVQQAAFVHEPSATSVFHV